MAVSVDAEGVWSGGGAVAEAEGARFKLFGRGAAAEESWGVVGVNKRSRRVGGTCESR